MDDALALILALRSPELSVKAITTVAGNAGVRKCTRNVHRVLDALQPVQRPPVVEGARKPLVRTLFTAPEVHGKDGLGDVKLFPPRIIKHQSRDAVQQILRLVTHYGRRLTIVALGPLTNIARALKTKPSGLRTIGRLISMGGAIRVPGNTGPVAEFNYYVDPEAAHLVLTSGIPVTVIPLDLTEQVALMRAEVLYRARRRSSKVARFIGAFTKRYMQYHLTTEGFLGGFVHDAIAVAVAIDRSLVRTQRLVLDVETTGTLTRGMSVADVRRNFREEKIAVDVALRIDKERFLKLFHDRLWT